ncbi:MAG TPA: SgcJ/EcaC family oxidoreductase [Pyrinomonadaceae bacterium]|nr:SgcJ/EcaC family oxidoreductase [Pyrinomonadaceae bacterium]
MTATVQKGRLMKAERTVSSDDEQAIRELVDNWIAASKKNDLATVLSLMADDVLFLVPGQKPFGKEAFAAANEKMKDLRFEGESDIQEIKVLGDWAWMHNFLRVTFTPPGGKPSVRSGHILTVLRKRGDGKWVIFRDANLLLPEAKE